jgi:GNAT superfamily N-acetyltransferase
MSRASVPSAIVRPYRLEDEAGVLSLLQASLGGGPVARRLPEFFRWKHQENPFGRSFMLVGEADGRIVGFRAFLRWGFRAGGQDLHAVRAVDTATHPGFQRMGIFSRLTREALTKLGEEADLVFNTPNQQSLPGYLKMGWRIVGRVPVRVRRPVRFFSRVRSMELEAGPPGPPPAVGAEPAAEVLRDGDDVSLLLEEQPVESRLSTPRSLEYFRWRYGAAPILDYRAIREEREGELRGLAIFRVRPRGRLWEATVAELIAPDGRTARRLLRRVSRAGRPDHLTCSFAPGSIAARAAPRVGFVRVPGGITFVVNPLREGIEPDPADLRSWALSLGDLEVF